MAEMIRVVNKESQNLHAETLLRLVGLKVKGEGSAEKGHEAVAELAKRLGVPDEGWGLVDGSGLARTDLLTPRGLVALLAAMDRHPHAAAFRDSLPVAGVDGTLERRMRGTPPRGACREDGTLRSSTPSRGTSRRCAANGSRSRSWSTTTRGRAARRSQRSTRSPWLSPAR